MLAWHLLVINLDSILISNMSNLSTASTARTRDKLHMLQQTPSGGNLMLIFVALLAAIALSLSLFIFTAELHFEL